MPIKVNVVDNNSTVKIGTRDNTSTIKMNGGSEVALRRLELLLENEVKQRIAGDEHLQEEIDAIVTTIVSGISIDEKPDGTIEISILDDAGQPIGDVATITYTGEIIDSGVLDYANSKITFTCKNGEAIEVDISDIIDAISSVASDLSDETTRATNEESRIEGKVDSLETRINNLDLTEVGGAGSYITTISQSNGQVSASAQAFDTDFTNATNNNVPTTLAVKTYVENEGGKIDSISINGVQQQIVNKNVDLPAYPTKTSLGLDQVDNTSDLNKPISTATQTALNAKQDTIDANHKLSSDLVDDTNHTNKFVTSEILNDISANTSARHTHSNKSILDNTTASYTEAEQTKLSGIETGAQVNVIETIKVNDSELTPTSKTVNIEVPTKTSDLTNDSDFTTTTYVDTELAKKVDKVAGYGLSQNDFTNALKSKLDGIASGAEVNTIVGVQVDGTDLTPDANRKVNVILSGKQDKIDSSHKLASDLVDDTNQTNKFVSASEKAQITTNKNDISNHVGNTSNPHSVTASQVGLGSVVNTGDSATPSENGTTKFTTGGAYTLQSTLQGNINTVDNKLDVNVHVEGSSDEITYSGDTVTKTSPYKNLKTGTTGSRGEVIHLANSTTAGMMSYTDYNQIRTNTARIEQLEGQTRRLLYTDSQNPTQQDIATFVDNYLISIGITPSVEEYQGIAVVVSGTYHIWHYYDTQGVGWKDDGLDTVSQFTNSIAGIILGSSNDGQVYAENDGTGSVYGWSALKNRVSNLESGSVFDVAYDTTNKKITKTIGSTTSDVVTTAKLKEDMSLASVASSGSYTDLINTPTYSLKGESSSATGRVQYLEDFTYTSASSSGSDTFVKSINAGSGSFTPTTKYLNANYVAGTAVRGGTTQYMHFSAGSTPSRESFTYATGSFSTAASMNFDTGNSGDASYISSISGGSAVSPTTKYLHASTTNAAPNAHTHTLTATGSVSLNENNSTSTGRLQYVKSFSAGTTPPSSASPSHTSTSTGNASGKGVDAITGISGGSGSLTSVSSLTPGVLGIEYLDAVSLTAASLGTASTVSAITGISGGDLYGTRSTSGSGFTARRKLTLTHSGASSSSTSNVVTGYPSFSGGSLSSTSKYLLHTHTGASVSSTSKVSLQEHTHSYDKTTSISLTAGTAPSVTTKYMDASFSGTSATTSANSGSAVAAITSLSGASSQSTGDVTFVESVSGGSAVSATTKYMKFTAPVLSTSSAYQITGVGSNPSLTFDTTSTNGEAYVKALDSLSSVGGSVTLTNSENSGIQYMEFATHTHTGASVNQTASAITGISGGSVSKTTKYLELDED